MNADRNIHDHARSETDRPRIAVTMGDPAGVGPELCLRALNDTRVQDACRPVVLGSAAILRNIGHRHGWPIPDDSIMDVCALDAESVQPGVIDARCGQAAYTCIETAIQSAIRGDIDAVTTGPVHKEALRRAGIRFPGHTEIFAAQTGAQRYCMMQTSSALTVSFVTTHIPVKAVADALTRERILDVIELTADIMTRLRGRAPRLAVCGLNPHAGEHGQFGDEETRVIAPAIESARKLNIAVVGPVPPDIAFLPEKRKETDAIVCMYHDQGHIPLKMLAFDSAVNITLGLPIIRTSVDHGTAFDIAWQGLANPGSLIQAILLAARLAVAR